MRLRSVSPLLIACLIVSCASLDGNDDPRSETWVKTPGPAQAFWRRAMTPELAIKYRATKKQTFCNVYVADTLAAFFGQEIFAAVFPDGVKAPHVLFREWQANPRLVRLAPSAFSLPEIQTLADEGFLVLLAYYYNKGPSHVAFVGPAELVLFTVPVIGKLEGKSAAALDADWRPVVVQAGTYAGVTSVAYASNGWFDASPGLFETGTVRFYLVRR
jgi:hypothetical protein